MPAVSTYSPTGDQYVDGVLSGVKWGVSSLTFSFPTDASFYGSGYGSGEPASNFEAFTATQQTAVRTVLQMYSSVANLTFTEVTETSGQHGDLRYAESDQPSTAWAYYPSTLAEGGDAWFNNSTNWYDNPVKGNYAWLTIIHETGHAMGLKHPQDSTGAFGTMPLDHDSLEYSVMSYRSYVGGPTSGYTNASSSYPQTLMMYDIAALQLLYGANYNTNAGDTVYSWSPTTGQQSINGVSQGTLAGNKIFMTLWDGGGHDTYNFSNYTGSLTVNLQPGAWTIVSTTQLASLGSGHTAVGNIANALLYNNNPASLIEDAVGGLGNDSITGNNSDNHLTGGAGNDALDGGNGADTAVFSGLLVNYQLVENANGTWTVTDLRGSSPDGVDTLSNIEQVQFSDQLVSLNSLLNPPSVAAPTITSFSDDSGATGDGITNDNTLTLIGTAVADCTVKIYDGVTLLGTVLADGSGAWSYTTTTLSNGSHSLTATATDGGGNTSSASAVLSVTVDTLAPTVSSVVASGTGITAGTGILSAGDVVTLTVNLSEAVTVVGGTPTLTLNDGGTATYTGGSGSSALAFSYTVAAGQNTADLTVTAVSVGTATVTDGAGNVADLAGAMSNPAGTLQIDTLAPTAPTIASFSSDSGTIGDGITNDNTLALTGMAEPNSAVRVYDGATLLNTILADGSGAWNYTTATLADGAHSLTAKATDAAGNTSAASSALSVTVDTVAPAMPMIASLAPGSGGAGNSIAGANILTLSGTAEANSTIKVYDGTTLLGSTAVNGSGAWTYSTTELLGGTHSMTATATDAAGNTSGAAALQVSVGLDGNDTLTGGAGNDILDGGLGADIMIGGTGNDTYYVDNAGDVVTELNGAPYAPPSGFVVKGTADLDGDGDLDVLISNPINNAAQLQLLQNGVAVSTVVLPSWAKWTVQGLVDANGDGKVDVLYQNGSSQWVEYLNGTTGIGGGYVSGMTPNAVQALPAGNQGTDTVLSSISYTLPGGVEKLTLAGGAGSIDGTGNGLDNVIVGNQDNNRIEGKAGVDTLTGNGGVDVFVFSTGDCSAAAGQHDLITDFAPSTDKLDLTGIDADSATSGIQSFRFLGTAAFDGAAGALHTVYDSARGVTVLEGDINGDKVADFAIDFAGNLTLSNADFTAGSLLLPVVMTGSGTLLGGGVDDILTGQGGNDTLKGFAGDDILNGGAGADIMIGGTGNDTYYVDDAGDVVTELGGSAYVAPSGFVVKGTADLDGDGDLDVLISNPTNNAAQLQLLQNGVAVSTVVLPSWAKWTVQGLADANGDGKVDVLYQSGSKQWVEYLNGTTDIGGGYVSGMTPNAVQAIPAGNQGVDTVISSISHTLSSAVEHLTLAGGAGSINGTGNGLDNVIVGNEGNNTLIGLGGNDRLDGGLGADIMIGGTGNDTYVVDNVGDVVTELGTPGFDMPAGWTLKGTADFNNDGKIDVVVTNGSVNQIWLIQNSAVLSTTSLPFWAKWPMQGIADLNGDGTKDVLFQSNSGNQQYAIYLDGVTQQGEGYVSGKTVDAVQPVSGTNEGIDTVEASISYTLGNSVENLTLVSGAGNINGTGNAAGNVIIGNEGNNVINGLAGNDTLTGGAGADTFVFAAGFGRDTVTDYHAGEDVIQIDQTLLADFAALIANATDDGHGNTIITVTASDTITLLGVTTSILQQHQSDFHIV